MDAQHFSRFGLIAFGSGQDGLDEFSFEFTDSFIEQNPLIDHFGDKQLHLLFHNGPSSAVAERYKTCSRHHCSTVRYPARKRAFNSVGVNTAITLAPGSRYGASCELLTRSS
jgi:hypothetical protein